MASASSSLQSGLQLHDPIDPAERLQGTPIVVAAFASPDEFLRAYHEEGPAGELSLVTRARPRSRAHLVVEVTFPGLPNRVFVRARVSRRRMGLIAKLHPDETAARDFLLSLARAEAVDYSVRMHERYCVRLPLGWRAFGAIYMNDGVAEDLSTRGVLVSTRGEVPAVREQVALRLRTAGQDLVVTGVVRHVRQRSNDCAFGVQFECRSSGEQRRLRRLLRAFAARGVVIIERS